MQKKTFKFKQLLKQQCQIAKLASVTIFANNELL